MYIINHWSFAYISVKGCKNPDVSWGIFRQISWIIFFNIQERQELWLTPFQKDVAKKNM
jgi:hypothetical protein